MVSEDPAVHTGDDNRRGSASDAVEVNEQAQGTPIPLGLLEVGSTGLAVTGGMVTEEFLPELSGARGRQVYKQMSQNDPIVGAFLFALNQLIGGLPWEWEAPEDADPLEAAATDFVNECWDDMDEPWDDTLEEILSFATYGWALQEVVYKVRNGPDAADPAYRSRFDDGRIGWRRFAPRGQNTLLRWQLDENGRALGMQQFDPYSGKRGEVYIPLAKAALFRITQNRNNPEGRSLLRTAYRPWLFKTRIEEFEAIGIERDLVGYPVVTTPAKWHLPTADAADRAALLGSRNLVKNMRRGQSEGAVIPAMFDQDGNQIYKVELITSGGSRQIDIGGVIERKNAEIAMSVLADFLTLGHEATGTYSLGTAKIDLWTLSIRAVAKSIAEVMNRHVVPKLLYLNGFAPSRAPKLGFGDVTRVDLSALGPFLKVLFDAQIITPDTNLEAWARDVVGAPPRMAPEEAEPVDPVAAAATAAARRPAPGSKPAAPVAQPGAVAPAAKPAVPAAPAPAAPPAPPVAPTPAAPSQVPASTPTTAVPAAPTVQRPAPVPVVSPPRPSAPVATQPTVQR